MRKLIVSLIALSLLILPLSAQSVRTDSLGVGADDVDDIGNLANYPQLGGLYQNKVWFYSIDDGDDVWLTTVLTELMGHTVGFQLVDVGSSNTSIAPYTIGSGSFSIPNYIGAPFGFNTADTVINLLFATELGGGNLGVNLVYGIGGGTYAWDEEDTSAAVTYTDDDSYDESVSYLGVLVGFSMEEVGPLSRLDTSVGIGLPGYELTYEDPVDSTQLLATPAALGFSASVEKDSGMDLEVNLQGVMERSEDSTLRVQVGFASSSLETTQGTENDGDNDGLIDGSGDSKEEYTYLESSSDLAVKAVLNKKVNDGGLVILGAGVGRVSWSDEYTEKDWDDPQGDGTWALETQDTTTEDWSALYIPVELAVEDMINDNVTLRLGAYKDVLIIESDENVNDGYGQVGGVVNSYGKNDTATTLDSYRSAYDVLLAMGVGVEFNNFVINVQTESDILVGGPYWITGDPSTFGMDAEVIYSF